MTKNSTDVIDDFIRSLMPNMEDMERKFMPSLQAMASSETMFVRKFGGRDMLERVLLGPIVNDMAERIANIASNAMRIQRLRDSVAQIELSMRREEREVNEFIIGMGLDGTEPVFERVSWYELLDDARTMRLIYNRRIDYRINGDDVRAMADILDKYEAGYYMPVQPVKRGRPRDANYDMALEWELNDGMSRMQSFERLVSDGYVTIPTQSAWEYEDEFERRYRAFNEAMRIRKNSLTI